MEKKIESFIETRNERMMEISGIGFVLCATILAEIGDIKRFDSFNKFYAYTGLEPRRFETGDSVSNDKVSHEGSRHLRRVFYKNMQVIIENNPYWRDYYKRKRKTKVTCVAYAHLIKKVLKAIFFITKNDVPYDPMLAGGRFLKNKKQSVA